MDAKTFASLARRRFTPIAGSRFLRGRCNRCGQPVRVTVEIAAKSLTTDHQLIWCRDCSPGGSSGSYGGSPQSSTDNSYHGGRFHSAEWEG